MMRSMYAGVSGIRAHQTMMDVIGNNVSNVNTVGFKSSRAIFADTLSQLIRGASSGNGQATGGISPQQVGMGTGIAAIDVQFTQGGSQLTGIATDVSIQGDGMFAVRVGSEALFTRAGSFHFDQNGFLVDPTGAVVQGWLADNTGRIIRSGPAADIKIPIGQTIDPVQTTSVTIRGNLSTATPTGGPPLVTMIDVIDGQGQTNRIRFEFTRTATNSWTMEAFDPANASIGTSTLTFDPADGRLTAPTTMPNFTFTPVGAAPVTFAVDLGYGATSSSYLTQYGTASDVQAVSQDGTAAGILRSFAISAEGTISGVYSNGASKPIGQLAVATFANPKGLLRAGDNHFRSTNAAGQALVGAAGEGGRGEINAGTLEMSNVELAQEFTSLILAQRGFQANSRVITTSDEMIQDLVNIKR